MPWRVRDAVLIVAVGLGVVVLLFAVAQGLDALQGAPGNGSAQPAAAIDAAATGVFYLGVLAGVWLLVVRRYRVPWRALGLAAPRAGSLLPVLLLAVLFVIGSTLILLVATLLVDLAGSAAYVAPVGGLPSVISGDTAPLAVIVVATSLLLAPVAEELLFRGVLYQALRQRGGKVLATGGSAVLFTLLHARPAVAPESLLLGVVLAMAFERTGSLYPSMCLHAAYNGIIIVLAPHAL